MATAAAECGSLAGQGMSVMIDGGWRRVKGFDG
jgi:hypothetical protein